MVAERAMKIGGVIWLNDTTAGGSSTFLSVFGNVTVDGTGSILFDSPNENTILQPNFDLTELIIGSGGHVRLTDFINNGNLNGPFGVNEALYVDTVRFLDGTGLLNTFCLNLYYKALIGNLNQIINDCTVQQQPPSTGVPEPSTWVLVVLGLLGLVAYRRFKVKVV
jgi:hypothetical protein